MTPLGEQGTRLASGIGALADPGNAGAIPVYASGAIALVTTGAQTRTLGPPAASSRTGFNASRLAPPSGWLDFDTHALEGRGGQRALCSLGAGSSNLLLQLRLLPF